MGQNLGSQFTHIHLGVRTHRHWVSPAAYWVVGVLFCPAACPLVPAPSSGSPGRQSTEAGLAWGCHTFPSEGPHPARPAPAFSWCLTVSSRAFILVSLSWYCFSLASWGCWAWHRRSSSFSRSFFCEGRAEGEWVPGSHSWLRRSTQPPAESSVGGSLFPQSIFCSGHVPGCCHPVPAPSALKAPAHPDQLILQMLHLVPQLPHVQLPQQQLLPHGLCRWDRQGAGSGQSLSQLRSARLGVCPSCGACDRTGYSISHP